jgi:hypothetical protein
MNYIQEETTTWEKFLEQNEPNDKKQFIYRGQTNEIDSKGNLYKWPIISLFKRSYSENEMKFESFLGQQFQKELYNYQFGEYIWTKEQNLGEMELMSKLIFLQHCGIPTCLIDFTYDPEIALYFALTSLKVGQVRSLDVTDYLKRTDFRDDYYLSIYKISVQALLQLQIKEIKEKDGTFAFNYDDYKKSIEEIREAHIGLVLSPEKMINTGNHYNMEHQKACFVLYDTYEFGVEVVSLDNFLETLAKERKEIITEPLIIHYKISWNSVLSKDKHDNGKNLFGYLRSKNKMGKQLFNDYQGLKYDLRFFGEQ